MECKDIYSELSKIIQSVLASRKELVKYDTHKGEMAVKEVDQEDGPHPHNHLLSLHLSESL